MRNIFSTIVFCCFTFFVFATTAFAQNSNNNRDDEQMNRYYRKPINHPTIYPDKVFCFYPLAAISGNFKIGLEKKLSDETSIKTNVRFGFGDQSSFYTYSGDNNPAIFGSSNSDQIRNFFMSSLEAQYRYYFSDKAPQGFYGGLYGFYKMATFTSTITSYTQVPYTSPYGYTYYNSVQTQSTQSPFVNGGGAGILIGVQSVSFSKLAVDMYMGSGMFFTSPNGKGFKGLGGVSDRYFNGIGFILGFNVGLASKK